MSRHSIYQRLTQLFSKPKPVIIRLFTNTLLACTAFGGALALVLFSEALQNAELMVYDHMLQTRTPLHHVPPITLITVTENDLRQLQHCSLPDAQLACLLNNLVKQRPRAIGLDLYRDIALAPGADELANVLGKNDLIVVAQKYGDGDNPGIPPPSYINDPHRAGCTDFPEDQDKYVRRALIYLGDDKPCYSLGYLLALRYLAHDGIAERGEAGDPGLLRLGKSSLPYLQSNDGGYRNMDDRGYSILLDFKTDPVLFKSYSFHDALSRVAPEDVTDKIILIGSVADSGKDFLLTPQIGDGFPNHKIPGLYVHGLFIDQLLRAARQGQPPLQTVSEPLEWLWTAVNCVAGVFLGARRLPLPIFVSLQAFGLVVDAAAVYRLFLAGIWLPLLPSAIGWLLSTIFTNVWLARREYRQRKLMMNFFARYVSRPIADEIWRQRDALLQDGTIAPQRMTATVFFSDLAEFTHITESLEPKIFIAWLDEYLDAMTSIIHAHGGVVIRFIGDAIMAGFGVPIPRNSDAEVGSDAIQAAVCALAIQEKLIQLNNAWRARGLPAAIMRIGINTGPLLACSLGCRDRAEYTIHGDTVNTASRLESHQKERMPEDVHAAPCRILISAETERHLPAEFRRASLGNVTFKGKEVEVEVFHLF